MGTSNYSDEFKRDAVQRITVRGCPVREVSRRLGVSSYSLYKWLRLFAEPAPKASGIDREAENRRLKRELARVTEERDILKKVSPCERVLRARVPMKYAFIRAHQTEFRVRVMCQVLRVHFSGFYAWLKEPLCRRGQEDARQTGLIRRAWSESGKVYGYRKLADDLRDQVEHVSENRVARLTSMAGIAAQVGYKRRPGRYGGKPAVLVNNSLDRQFEVDAPDRVWVTDITYIKTHEAGCIFRS